MTFREEFSKRLRERRIEQGIEKQDDLGKAIGASVQAISGYEKAERLPNAEIVAKMAKALNCTADYLLLLEDSPNHESIDAATVTGLSARSIKELSFYASEECPIAAGTIIHEFIDSFLMSQAALHVAGCFDLWVAAVQKHADAEKGRPAIEAAFREWMAGGKKDMALMQRSSEKAFAIDNAESFEDVERYRLVRAFEAFLDELRGGLNGKH